jgi:hypothetical protein
MLGVILGVKMSTTRFDVSGGCEIRGDIPNRLMDTFSFMDIFSLNFMF